MIFLIEAIIIKSMLFFFSNFIKRIKQAIKRIISFFKEAATVIVPITSIGISFMAIFKFETLQMINVNLIFIGDFTLSLGIVISGIAFFGVLAVFVLPFQKYAFISMCIVLLQGYLVFFFKSLSLQYKHFTMFNPISNSMQNILVETYWCSVQKVFTKLDVTDALFQYRKTNHIFNSNVVGNDELLEQYYYFFDEIKNFDLGNLFIALHNIKILYPIVPVEEQSNLYLYVGIAFCFGLGFLGTWYFYPAVKLLPVVLPVATQAVPPLTSEKIIFITKVTNNILFDSTFGFPVFSCVIIINKTFLDMRKEIRNLSLPPDQELELHTQQLIPFYEKYIKDWYIYIS